MLKIRIATFNVHFGKNPEKIAKEILNNANLSKLDILLLQEIESHKNEAKERAQHLADELGMSFLYVPAREIKTGSHGLAILSRYPIKDYEIISLSFYNLRIHSRTRVAVSATIEVGGKDLHVCNVHLDTRLNIDERIAQLQQVVDKINGHHIKSVVMGGDLNTIPLYWVKRIVPVFYSKQKRLLHKFLQEAGFESKTHDLGSTMRFNIVRWGLDALYTRNLNVAEAGVERKIKASDHVPIWVDVEL